MVTDQSQNKNKVIWLQVIFIALGLFGYEIISFIPAELGIADSRLFSVPYRALFLGLSILVLVKRRSYKIDRRNSFLLIILTFWVLYIFRLIYDTVFNFSIIIKPIGEYWLFAIGLCFIPSLGYKTKINKNTLIKALYVTYFAVLIVNLLGLNNNVANIDAISIDRQSGNDFLNPITYGQAGTSLAILSLVLFYRIRRGKKWRSLAYLYLLGFPLGVITLGLALSRGPIVQLIILLILFFYNTIKSIYVKIISLIIIAALFLMLIFSTPIPILDNIFDLIQSTGSSLNDSDSERLQLLNGGWNQFIQNPIFGDLLEERTLHAYPHNLIVEALMTCGILGGVLMITIQIKSIFQGAKLLKNPDTSWVALLFFMTLISSTFAGGIYADSKFWYLLLFVNVLYFQQRVLAKHNRYPIVN